MRSSFIALPVQFLAALLSTALLHSSIHVSASTSTPLPTDEHGDYNGMDLIEWIRSHEEGIIHPSVRIGRERPGDPTSINGLFVSSAPDAKPIEEGDVIAQIPWDQMIHPGKKYGKFKFSSCAAINAIAKELKLGVEKSTRAPYVRYLLSQPRGSMPGEWTEAGKSFLSSQVLGKNGDLPPYEDTWRTMYEDGWVQECSGRMYDEIEKAAFWLSSSRDEDTLMVPIYDMANHSNDPKKLNTLSHKPDYPGEPFRYVARRKIMPGEQIYNSYNRCNQCSTDEDRETCDTFSNYRTPDVFTHFGFVEDYPQNWAFDPDLDSSDDSSDDDETEFQFCMIRDDETGEVDAYWDEDEMPDEEDAVWMKGQLARLEQLSDEKDELEKKLVQADGEEGSEDKMTRWEWESTWRYHESLSLALAVAIQTAESAEEDSRDEL